MTEIVKYFLPLISPLGVGIALLTVALVLLFWKPKHRSGRILVAAALGVLLLGSLPQIPTALMRSMEYKYPPADIEELNRQKVTTVVVLGAGVLACPERPITSDLSRPSLIRLIEGIRLYRQLNTPDSRLVLCGRGKLDASEAVTMKDLALQLGVVEQDIILENESMDTADQARLLLDMIGEAPFALVTDASHMPRSIKAFSMMGMSPQAAPTSHLTLPGPFGGLSFSLPHSTNILHVERFIYEALGSVRTDAEIRRALAK